MKLPFTTAPGSLCVLRLSAVGDVCHTLAVIRNIQSSWPQTKLTWIIGKLEATLLDDIPDIEFIIFDKSRGWNALRQLRRQLKQRHFDALLHMQVSLRSSLASRLVQTPIRLGFDQARAKDFQWLFTNARIAAIPQQHVLDGLFEFARAIGVLSRNLRWDIPIPRQAHEFVQQYIPQHRPYAVISPCSSARFRNWRNWSVAGYSALCDYLDQHGIGTVLTGGPTDLERDYGNQIMQQAKCQPVNIVGKTNLKQLLAAIAGARLLISPDSGPAHMATAVNTPVVGLYASSNPARTGPYLSQSSVVNKYPQALLAECGKSVEEVDWGQRVRDPDAMHHIELEDVLEKIAQLI
jgi:heptosyltransferase I